MKNVIKILVVISSIPLFVLGVRAMFAPMTTFELFDLDPRGVFGMNNIRADLGGMLIASALMILIGLWRQNHTWFFATILMMSTLLVGRIISFIVDGWTSAAIPAVVVEIFVIGVLFLANSKLTQTKE
ncbi:MAG: DUF4345 domain-containing protein [Cyclobacteriaceae bacterium]|nr:DUF4345 domain-containing protein [Cyclobacteriaceae bacterium]MDH4298893.1 DUF4345 domain-containing protein [Cyclobacteriaceae bacterium]MDH5250925.1 DUF4345 domain-containing protein [Cyclobacteriaceae bacterium]